MEKATVREKPIAQGGTTSVPILGIDKEVGRSILGGDAVVSPLKEVRSSRSGKVPSKVFGSLRDLPVIRLVVPL